FILPVDSVVSSPAGVRSLTPIPLHAAPRRRVWPSYVQGMVRTVSTIAAILGIVFLLSGLIGIAPARGGAASMGSSAQSQVVPASGQQNGALTPSMDGQRKSPTAGASVKTPAAPSSGNYPRETPATHPASPFAQTSPSNPWQFLIRLFD